MSVAVVKAAMAGEKGRFEDYFQGQSTFCLFLVVDKQGGTVPYRSISSRLSCDLIFHLIPIDFFTLSSTEGNQI